MRTFFHSVADWGTRDREEGEGENTEVLSTMKKRVQTDRQAGRTWLVDVIFCEATGDSGRAFRQSIRVMIFNFAREQTGGFQGASQAII